MERNSDSKINRRRFLKLTAAGVAASSLAHLAGCGSQPAGSPTSASITSEPTALSAPAAATAAVPTVAKRLKTLRFAKTEVSQPAETMDAAFGLSHMSVICPVFDQLVELDENFIPRPMLAESWEAKGKGDEWNFKIRKDVTFHDGDKLTAKDIVYTYRRLLDPQTASAGAAGLAGIDPEGIDAPDDYTVRFKLPHPIVDLPVMLNTKFSYVIKDGYTRQDMDANPIGSGPFKVERFVPGEDPIILVKNAKYWREGRPKVDVLEIRGIGEAAARTAALVRGQIDIAEDVALNEVAALEANPDVKVMSAHSGNWDAFIVMCDKPPFDDVRVRQALKYCLDRPTLVDLVLNGYGTPALDCGTPSWFKYGLPDPAWPQDIAKAKALLAEAGYPNGIEVELWTTTLRPSFVPMATACKEMWAKAGINVNIQMGAPDTFWTEVWMVKPFAMTAWSARPIDGILAEAFLSTSEWNETHWYRKEFDDLFYKARATLDEAERTSLYQQAQRLIVEDGGAIAPFFWDSVAATRANVTGWKPTGRETYFDFSTADILV